MANLERRTAFVTGGAHGIGRACVERLHAAGAAVVFGDIETDAGRDLAASIADEPGRVEFVECDVRSEDDLAHAESFAIDRFGSLDIVVANAATETPFDAAEMSGTEWDEYLAVDLKSVWLTAKHALPQMRKQRRGSIVTVASIHASITSTGKFPYAAAKAGVVGLTRSLALDEAKYQIRVNAVCPGYTRTRMLMRGVRSAANPAAVEREMLAIHPLGRIAEPAEIANVVAFLASDEASFITAASVMVDGGLSARFV